MWPNYEDLYQFFGKFHALLEKITVLYLIRNVCFVLIYLLLCAPIVLISHDTNSQMWSSTTVACLFTTFLCPPPADLSFQCTLLCTCSSKTLAIVRISESIGLIEISSYILTQCGCLLTMLQLYPKQGVLAHGVDTLWTVFTYFSLETYSTQNC